MQSKIFFSISENRRFFGSLTAPDLLLLFGTIFLVRLNKTIKQISKGFYINSCCSTRLFIKDEDTKSHLITNKYRFSRTSINS